MNLLHVVLQATATSPQETWTILGGLAAFVTALLTAIGALFVKLFAMVREAQNGAGEKRNTEVRQDIQELKQETAAGFERAATIQNESLKISQEMLQVIRGGTCPYASEDRRVVRPE